MDLLTQKSAKDQPEGTRFGLPVTKREFYTELEIMLGLPADAICGDEALDALPGWDSMAILCFIALADSTLGVIVSAAQLSAAKTVPDLVALFPGKIR
jgi:hypothetical protein